MALPLAGCGGPDQPARSRDSLPGEADSLALRADHGVEIWYTLVRSARSPQGLACSERALQIRRGDRRIQVPLLYTGETPSLVDDSTMRAVLWTGCRPLKPYLVNLRTGQPRPEGETSRK